ncbi:thiamine ABC transporter substrate binding subunit [Pseudogemmobacter blasticus]|uniref:Thiamine-binding periplasmic protein n=1 Tax=Fuscovulum blasticum DSM 2131 TaxID=1188250 RepID=A0A2T4JBG0_FUSBL|nr:thiamine ABC transporter substrate binding subunit [Fuscovulum blasticum]PTE15229.1 thiamine ABC transporter substrate binding subunit [Fuscovulum blasticum DSM 2131]
MRPPFLAATVVFLAASAATAETPVLTVLTYDSFVSEWGPGPAVEKAFEETCGCDLRFVAAGDGAALLSRLKLEGAASEADVVLGLDTNLVAEATATGLFAPHGQPAAAALPVAWDDPLFLPYDWGWFAFVYDKTRLTAPPASFEALAASDVKIVIQDPRSSTPGLGLLMWVKAAYGDRAPEIWKGLADNIVTVTPGWSESYGLFLQGEADMVLSYTTSPAYHRIAEKDDSKDWAPFSEGHSLQVEVSGVLAASDQPDLARAFVAFTQTPGFQSVIPETNWMYPASETALPEGFETARPEKSLLMTADEARAARDGALAEWQAALAQ